MRALLWVLKIFFTQPKRLHFYRIFRDMSKVFFINLDFI